jgi:hypothetical protein
MNQPASCYRCGASLVLSDSQGSDIRAATAAMLTTTIASLPSTAPSHSVSTISAPPHATNSNPLPPTRSIGLTSAAYAGAYMTALIPVDWRIQESEVQKSGYIESKWINPTGTAYILIDESPATHLTPEQDAAAVHAASERSNGYRTISYGPGDLDGVKSWMWVFELPATELIDYFFERCTDTFGGAGSDQPR